MGFRRYRSDDCNQLLHGVWGGFDPRSYKKSYLPAPYFVAEALTKVIVGARPAQLRPGCIDPPHFTPSTPPPGGFLGGRLEGPFLAQVDGHKSRPPIRGLPRTTFRQVFAHLYYLCAERGFGRARYYSPICRSNDCN